MRQLLARLRRKWQESRTHSSGEPKSVAPAMIVLIMFVLAGIFSIWFMAAGQAGVLWGAVPVFLWLAGLVTLVFYIVMLFVEVKYPKAFLAIVGTVLYLAAPFVLAAL